MVRTESTMLTLGSHAPDFTLPEPATGRSVSLSSFDNSHALLVIFMCNHCPYVLHLHAQLNDLIRKYQPKGLAAVAINSNDVANYPDDSPEKMVEVINTMDYCFPYLFDEDQSVAKLYRAACTPDFFIFDNKMKLAYRGQFDSSRPNNGQEVTGNDMAAAIESVLAGKPIAEDSQLPSMGCNIKWKQNNAPDYFS